MDMLRWPQIIRLTDLVNTDSARFIVVMESNGRDPFQRDPNRGSLYPPTPEAERILQESGRDLPGIIFRQDVVIPHKHRNDPEYIASQFAAAWSRILAQAVSHHAAVAEGADFAYRPMTREEFSACYEKVFMMGADPDILYVPLENAYERGLIGPWEFRWRKLLRSIGTWKRNVLSGARSALRTRGTPAREQ